MASKNPLAHYEKLADQMREASETDGDTTKLAPKFEAARNALAGHLTELLGKGYMTIAPAMLTGLQDGSVKLMDAVKAQGVTTLPYNVDDKKIDKAMEAYVTLMDLEEKDPSLAQMVLANIAGAKIKELLGDMMTASVAEAPTVETSVVEEPKKPEMPADVFTSTALTYVDNGQEQQLVAFMANPANSGSIKADALATIGELYGQEKMYSIVDRLPNESHDDFVAMLTANQTRGVAILSIDTAIKTLKRQLQADLKAIPLGFTDQSNMTVVHAFRKMLTAHPEPIKLFATLGGGFVKKMLAVDYSKRGGVDENQSDEDKAFIKEFRNTHREEILDMIQDLKEAKAQAKADAEAAGTVATVDTGVVQPLKADLDEEFDLDKI